MDIPLSAARTVIEEIRIRKKKQARDITMGKIFKSKKSGFLRQGTKIKD